MSTDIIDTAKPVLEIASPAERARTQWRYDAMSTGSGVVLALFMWGHMAFISSIWAGERRFDWIADMMEQTWIAQLTVVAITVLFFMHFVMASRKIPAKLQDRRLMENLGKSIEGSEWRFTAEQKKQLEKIRPHRESSLWIWQVRTGMVILAIGSIHIFLVGYDVIQRVLGGAGISAAESMGRVSSGMWILYAVLLFAVEMHAGIGLYRVMVKWGLGKRVPLFGKLSRRGAYIFEQVTLWFFLAVGVVTLLVLAGALPPPLASLELTHGVRS